MVRLENGARRGSSRLFVILLIAATFIAVIGVHSATAPIKLQAATTSPNLPNILIIVTDDQRLGSLSSLPRTMHWFRHGGRTFTNAFDTTPLCCPSRSSIFTGLFAHNHGVIGNTDASMLPLDRTIQRYLGDAGYQRAIAGKYVGHSLADPPYWDHWAIMKPPAYYNADFNIDGVRQVVPEYTTDFIAQKASEDLTSFESDDSRPWLLYVAPNAPHPPATPEPDYAHAPVPPFKPTRATHEKNRSDKPGYVRHTRADMTNVRAFYRRQLRTLMSVDDLVDGLFTQMQTLDETRSTLAIFISDNGYMWGDHGLFNKRFPYTPSIKVPMFMRWPGHVTPGSKDDRMVANIDIAPTIMKATKIKPPYPMDGRPLLGNHVRSRMLNEYFQDVDSRQIPTWASIRTARYQYIESYNKEPIGTSAQVYGRAGNQPIRFQEYYDLKKDPWQNHNILRDHHPGNDPDVGRLHRMLAHDRACSAKACP